MIKSVLMVKVLSVQIVSSRLLLSNLNKCGVVTFENNAICLVDQHGRLSAQIALPVFFLCNFGLEHYISITLHLYSRPLNKLDKFFLQKITFWPGVDGRNLHVLILNYTCISFFSGLIFKTNFSHQGMKIRILIGLLNWLIWFDQVPCIEISSIIDVCCWATTVKKALLYCRALNSTEPVSCPPLMM